MAAIINISEFREHTVSQSFSSAEDLLVASYVDAAESWVLAFLNLTHADLIGIDPKKFSIIKQSVLMLASQFYMQREEVGPHFLRRSHLTAEKLLSLIRGRQMATLTDSPQSENEEVVMLKILGLLQTVSDVFKFPHGAGRILLKNQIAGDSWLLEFLEPGGTWLPWPRTTPPVSSETAGREPEFLGHSGSVSVVAIANAPPTADFRLRRATAGAEAWIY